MRTGLAVRRLAAHDGKIPCTCGVPQSNVRRGGGRGSIRKLPPVQTALSPLPAQGLPVKIKCGYLPLQ